MTILDAIRELFSTFEEIHYFMVGLAAGFIGGCLFVLFLIKVLKPLLRRR